MYNYTCEEIMLTKLTLTIDQAVVDQAKKYALKKKRSVSRIVEEYLENITLNRNAESELAYLKSPITDTLSGMFYDSGKPYREMLNEALAERHL
jgi:hypothetical protein